MPGQAPIFQSSFVQVGVGARIFDQSGTDSDGANLMVPSGIMRAQALAAATSPMFGTVTAVHIAAAEFFSAQSGRVTSLWG